MKVLRRRLYVYGGAIRISYSTSTSIKVSSMILVVASKKPNETNGFASLPEYMKAIIESKTDIKYVNKTMDLILVPALVFRIVFVVIVLVICTYVHVCNIYTTEKMML